MDGKRQPKDKDWNSVVDAVEAGGEKALDALLKKGINIDVRDFEGTTPLMVESDSGCSKAVKLLISKGADVNAKDGRDWTPLMYACYGGDEDIADYLIGQGADINARNNAGETALDMVLRLQREEPESSFMHQSYGEVAWVLYNHGAKETSKGNGLEP